MGSRGASSKRGGTALAGGRRGGKMGDFLTPNEEPELDADLVRRANAAGTVVDYGDSAVRQYKADVSEIRGMDLTDEEKTKAIKDVHELTTKQLEAESRSLSPYSYGVGPARANVSQMRQRADTAAQARQNVRSYMNNLREDQKKKAKVAADQRRFDAMKKALANGELSVTVDGVTYTRPSKRSKTFTRQ